MADWIINNGRTIELVIMLIVIAFLLVCMWEQNYDVFGHYWSNIHDCLFAYDGHHSNINHLEFKK